LELTVRATYVASNEPVETALASIPNVNGLSTADAVANAVVEEITGAGQEGMRHCGCSVLTANASAKRLGSDNGFEIDFAARVRVDSVEALLRYADLAAIVNRLDWGFHTEAVAAFCCVLDDFNWSENEIRPRLVSSTVQRAGGTSNGPCEWCGRDGQVRNEATALPEGLVLPSLYLCDGCYVTILDPAHLYQGDHFEDEALTVVEEQLRRVHALRTMYLDVTEVEIIIERCWWCTRALPTDEGLTHQCYVDGEVVFEDCRLCELCAPLLCLNGRGVEGERAAQVAARQVLETIATARSLNQT
jgi:hypothetical protein